MKIKFLGTTSNGGHCPTVYATDRGTLLFQGDEVTDVEALATVHETYAGLGPNETAVEVPIALLEKLPTELLEAALAAQAAPSS